MFVKPAPGLLIQDPALRDRLPAAGRDVPEDDYWLRRVRDGDVLLVDEGDEKDAAAGTAADQKEG